MERYNPADNSWQPMMGHEISSHNADILPMGDSIYVSGGENYKGDLTRAVYKYIPHLNALPLAADMNRKKFKHALVHVPLNTSAHHLLTIGGSTQGYYGQYPTDMVDMYHIETDEWLPYAADKSDYKGLRSLSAARTAMGAVLLSESSCSTEGTCFPTLYVAGGEIGKDRDRQVDNGLMRYKFGNHTKVDGRRLEDVRIEDLPAMSGKRKNFRRVRVQIPRHK